MFHRKYGPWILVLGLDCSWDSSPGTEVTRMNLLGLDLFIVIKPLLGPDLFIMENLVRSWFIHCRKPLSGPDLFILENLCYVLIYSLWKTLLGPDLFIMEKLCYVLIYS